MGEGITHFKVWFPAGLRLFTELRIDSWPIKIGQITTYDFNAGQRFGSEEMDQVRVE